MPLFSELERLEAHRDMITPEARGVLEASAMFRPLDDETLADLVANEGIELIKASVMLALLKHHFNLNGNEIDLASPLYLDFKALMRLLTGEEDMSLAEIQALIQAPTLYKGLDNALHRIARLIKLKLKPAENMSQKAREDRDLYRLYIEWTA